MTRRGTHGDDWIEVLGGVLVGLVSVTWSLLVLVFRFFQWVIGRFRSGR